MELDYYGALNLNRNANLKDIHRAYRNMALKLHPIRNKDSQSKRDTSKEFILISEAYEILSNPQLRAIYDQFGEKGLKKGAQTENGWSEKYLYHGDPYKTFQYFFGGKNPFYEYQREMDKEEMENFNRPSGNGQLKKSKPIEQDLCLTLEEIYNGCIKRIKISRRVIEKECHNTEIKDKVFSVKIHPGLKEGTRITYANEGDEGPNTLPGDVIFILKALHHPLFRRDGINLYHTATIPLGQALLGCVLNIKTLDDRTLHIPITEIIHPQFIKRVDDEGMPDSCSPAKKGNLYIDFDIIFPRHIVETQKLAIEAALFSEQRIPV